MRYINKTRFFAVFFTITLLFTLFLSYAKSAGTNISKSVLRLHVIANSNSHSDQQLKLRVRDSILNKASSLFSSTASSDEALRIADTNASFLKEIAEKEIRRYGYDYPVSVTVGESAFPTKTYDDITLPAGKYNAVRIEIGEAKGENWWCVMYPPLCFTNGILSVSDNSKTQLKNSLSESDYKLISQKSAPVKVRFKIVEFFQSIF